MKKILPQAERLNMKNTKKEQLDLEAMDIMTFKKAL